jgi:nitrous oxide reductase accessory protein NosL
MTRRGMLGLVLGAVLVVGCKGDGDRPIDPVWGKQPCEHCKMLVDDRRSAAQVVTAIGDRLYFDDVGCMVAWLDEHKDSARAWVRMPSGDGWLDARGARYVAGEKTPMDFGYVPSGTGDLDYGTVSERVLARVSKKVGAP